MKLIPLRCPVCGQPLVPQEQDVVTACGGCRTAVQLDRNGVSAADILYAAAAAKTVPSHWLPFWIFYGRVTLGRRVVQEGRSREEAARAFWAEPRRFYVPAWEISLRTAREFGGRLLQAQPRYRSLPRPEDALLVPARLRAEDAQKLIEFIVLDLEVRRDDWLENVTFTVSVDTPALWAVPAVRAGQQWLLVGATDDD